MLCAVSCERPLKGTNSIAGATPPVSEVSSSKKSFQLPGRCPRLLNLSPSGQDHSLTHSSAKADWLKYFGATPVAPSAARLCYATVVQKNALGSLRSEVADNFSIFSLSFTSSNALRICCASAWSSPRTINIASHKLRRCLQLLSGMDASRSDWKTANQCLRPAGKTA